MECVFQMTAWGVSHLLSVAFIPPPSCLCVSVRSVWAQKLIVPTVNMCMCAPRLPDQATPAAISAHDPMCNLSFLMHYQPVHWHSLLTYPAGFHTSRSLCASLSYPQMTTVKCKFIVARYHQWNTNMSIKLADILHDAVIVVLLICTRTPLCSSLSASISHLSSRFSCRGVKAS